LYPAHPARRARAGHKSTPDIDWASVTAPKHHRSRVDITGCRGATDFADHLLPWLGNIYCADEDAGSN